MAVGPVDVYRVGGSSFIAGRGLTLYEPCLGALEMFLTARLFMYQQVYFHRTVRAIDLDLAEVFAPSIRAIFGDGSQTRSFCYVSDLIRGIIGLAESGHHHPVNIGNPNDFPLLHLA